MLTLGKAHAACSTAGRTGMYLDTCRRKPAARLQWPGPGLEVATVAPILAVFSACQAMGYRRLRDLVL